MTDAQSPKVFWAVNPASRPLCDIPWHGKSVVLSNGMVHFCCFSNAIVGDVHKESFESIWNGAQMQQIRGALTKHQFPIECQSPSCPIYSGGHYDSMSNRFQGESAEESVEEVAKTQIGARFKGTELRIAPEVVPPGNVLAIELQVQYDGPVIGTELYAALRYPDGNIRFFPSGNDVAIPFLSLQLQPNHAGESLKITMDTNADTPTGEYRVCAAFFEAGAPPTIARNCYWSVEAGFHVAAK